MEQDSWDIIDIDINTKHHLESGYLEEWDGLFIYF
jgi:hypothetical protein